MISKKVRKKSVVALKADPSRIGQVIEVSRSGRVARILFQGHTRPTRHATCGLILISTAEQQRLF